MSSVSFVVPGRIGGKGRARAAVRRSKSGKQFVQLYTPKKTANMEAMIRQFGAEAMRGRPLLKGPLVLDISVTLNHPASWSKKRKATTLYVTGRPDLDNICKGISDSLNRVCFLDDSQISVLNCRRRYNDGEPEQVEVKIFTPGGTETEGEIIPWEPRKALAQ